MRVERMYLGETPKFKVEMSALGFDIDTDSWSVTITGGGTSQTFDKTDCVHNANGWFVCFDTTDFGVGTYYATLTALIPDQDFAGGFRTGKKQFVLGVCVDLPADTIVW